MHADVIIVGGGLHGCSSAFQLVRQGRSVILLERDHVARHASGASAGGVRRVRRHTAELPLATRSLEMWQQLPTLIGHDCNFKQSGHLLLAETADDLQWAHERAAKTRALGYDFEEVIDAAEVRRLVPSVAVPVLGGLIGRSDGFADPLVTTATFRKKAEQLGARVIEMARVEAIERQKAGWWKVITSVGRFTANSVVNTAGAWSHRIAAMIGETIPLQFEPDMMTVTARVPRFLEPVIGHVSRKLSIKQVQNGTVVIGGGYHGRADLNAGTSDIAWELMPKNLGLVVHFFPCLRDVPIVRCWAGIEAVTPDGLPILGPSTVDPSFIHSFGYSSHGFQLGPVCGEIVKDLVIHGTSDLPLEPFRPSRFADIERINWGVAEGTARETLVTAR